VHEPAPHAQQLRVVRTVHVQRDAHDAWVVDGERRRRCRCDEIREHTHRHGQEDRSRRAEVPPDAPQTFVRLLEQSLPVLQAKPRPVARLASRLPMRRLCPPMASDHVFALRLVDHEFVVLPASDRHCPGTQQQHDLNAEPIVRPRKVVRDRFARCSRSAREREPETSGRVFRRERTPARTRPRVRPSRGERRQLLRQILVRKRHAPRRGWRLLGWHRRRRGYHAPLMDAAQNEAWNVAVVGSGPSAFYAAEALFKSGGNVRVDLFDRLPVPFGLVRGGVAPDHQNIKGVVKVYDKIAANPGFRFLGNVRIGRDLAIADLAAHYHQIVYAFGCESDQKLGVAGEELAGVHSATEFVGWYNAHPDHRDRKFDLARAKRVAIVGNGNVAMDVARVLLASPEHLATTDIADYALDALRRNGVREVILLGRRGPAQAAFSPKEIEEIAELPDVDVVVSPAEVALDPLSAAWLEKDGARSQQRNVKFLQERAPAGEGQRPKKLRCRFLVGPTELQGEGGRLRRVRLQHMALVADTDGTPRPKAIDRFEDVEVDLLFKAIGYRGVPVDGVPFDDKKGIVPNVDGRVVEKNGGAVRAGHYCVGWCKRGPTGLIGTNSLDAKATVEAMLVDRAAGTMLRPDRADVTTLLAGRGVDIVDWADWKRLDAWEQEKGREKGKLRHKLATIESMLQTIRTLRPRRAGS